MPKRFSQIQKFLIYGILILLIGMSFVSSTGKNIEFSADDHLEIVKTPRELQTCEHLVYFGGPTNDPWECTLYKGILNDIENSTCICGGGVSGDFLSGSTWTNDARLLACEYGTGRLWELDYETCDCYCIGGGGVMFNSLAYDPTTDILYGCSSYALYKINVSTGDHTYIGSFGSDSNMMIGLSCDAEGELYGWDVGEDSLWIIDKETGEAYLVGPLGIDITYAQDGDFCKFDDILYLAAYMTSPQSGSYLVECDKETGECTIISQFPNSQEISIFVVPWNFHPYAPSNYSPCGEVVEDPFNMSWDGGDPDSGDMVYYDVYFGLYEPPTQLFATVGPYPADQKRIEFGPVSLPLFEIYYWKVVAWDNHGACTGGPICNFYTRCKPDKPTIDGPPKGRPGIVYNFTFVTHMPDNLTIKYYVEWGDGSNIETGFFESGEVVTLNHSWDEKGSYILKAKAIDEYAQESNWSEFEVAIPKSKLPANSFFSWIIKRYLLFEILFSLD